MSVQASDNWSEQKVYAADGNPQAWLGSAVAISGDFALVGAKNATVKGRQSQGAVYVYRKVKGAWQQIDKLTALDGATGDQFGTSVALFGELAIITAPFAAVNGKTWQGAAYAFAVGSQGGKQTQKLVLSSGRALQTLGMVVCMNSTWAFISAGGANHGGTIIPYQVFAFKYAQTGSSKGWSEHSTLNCPDQEDPASAFGASLAVLDKTLLIGSRTASPNGLPGQGMAYAYTLADSGNWVLGTRLIAPDGAARDNFGVSVGLAPGQAFVGAFGATINGNVSQGAVYRFVLAKGQWSLAQKISAKEGTASNLFGASIAIWKNTLLVGAYAVDVYRGAAYVFAPQKGVWRQTKTLEASDGSERDVFGYYATLSETDALIGAYGASIVSDRQGAAYFFAVPQKGPAVAFSEAAADQS